MNENDIMVDNRVQYGYLTWIMVDNRVQYGYHTWIMN